MVEEADTVINAMALINALVLTIPFTIASSLNHEYWNTLKLNVQICSDIEYTGMKHAIIGPLYTSMCSTTFGLVITLIYYFNRPKGPKHFAMWWKHRGIIISHTPSYRHIPYPVSSYLVSSYYI